MASRLSAAEELAWRPYIEASLRLETRLDSGSCGRAQDSP